jgi:hypothetical protein
MSGAPVPAQAPALNYMQIYRGMNTPQLISEAWDNRDAVDPKLRDRVMTAMLERERKPEAEGGGAAAWPSGPVAAREEMAGLYPDPADPQFAARLFSKREFYEARAVAAGVADGTIDPCTSAAAEKVFELTPVQRVVSRFMHPLTPYQGMLLFHGVGVGKTCSAVTIAEQFLEAAPTTKVIVLVPQALKENFKKTVFDPSKLTWSAGQWQTQQCTGTAYLERLGILDNPDIKAVAFKTEEDKRARYTVTGYQAFANWIERTLKKNVPAGLVDPAARAAAENEVLRRLFSDHLIIIDEAHNMRDIAEDRPGVAAAAAGAAADPAPGEAAAPNEAAENAGGKALNPYLRRIVLNAEGLRLVLMTATPMYNSSPEIVLMLNYLLMNDSKLESSAMKMGDLFTKEGDIKPGAPQRLLERAARRYVSYMRGENPYTFPLRMRPSTAPAEPAALWPEISATKNPVVFTEQDTAAINALPLYFTEPAPGSPPERLLRAATGRAAAAAGTDEAEAQPKDVMLDYRMQMANISYPNDMFGTAGFDNYFTAQRIEGADHKLRVFTPKGLDIDSVFAGDGLRNHAPKIHTVVESIKKARGICFAYSRYIKAGALPMAIALERAGFQRRLADGTLSPLLRGVSSVAPVCAICGERDGAGHAATHPFQPACYILLTSEDDLSPKFAGLVRQATTWTNPTLGPLGANVKAIIGSQVASEGLDLKCVREMHVVDSWYHLNRTEQIIGRAIRYCSHSALRAVEEAQGLPLMALNNCLIYLHALRVPDVGGVAGFETADMYAYRIAIGKAQMIGKVQRLLKRHAWDCNLELEAITFTGLPPRKQIDAQGVDRRSVDEAGAELDGYSINDQDYTTYCDYQVCRHECAVTIARTEAEGLHIDISTFSVSDARRLVLAKQAIVRRLFEDQVMVPESVIQDIFGDLPWEIASEALMELIDGRRFRLRRPDGVEGFLVKKAGYVVFQPSAVADTDIPMTMRYARAFQLRRQFMEPRISVFGRAEEAAEPAAAATAAPKLATKAKTATATAAEPPPALAEPGGGGGGVAAGAAAAAVEEAAVVAAVVPDALMARWKGWLAFVNSGGTGAWPASMPGTLQLWAWLLQRYAAVPEVRDIALRWWFDKLLTYPEQRIFYEAALTGADAGDGAIEALQALLKTDTFKNKQLLVYRIFNPETVGVETFNRPVGAVGAAFTAAPPNIAEAIGKVLGNKPVAIPDETGTLFGFLAPKAGRTVFKTLDTTKPKKHSAVGAECGNVSNLGEHHPRVRALHEAGAASELAPLMLPDDDASWTAAARSPADKPKHMKDLTHQPLCLYMEFLARILDARRVIGRRWFLSAVVAAQSGLKGKK